MMTTSIQQHPFVWEEHLRKICFAYNTSIHSTTGQTPFFLMFGRQVRLPVDLMYNLPEPAVTLPDYVAHLKRALLNAFAMELNQMAVQQLRQRSQSLWQAICSGRPSIVSQPCSFLLTSSQVPSSMEWAVSGVGALV